MDRVLPNISELYTWISFELLTIHVLACYVGYIY